MGESSQGMSGDFPASIGKVATRELRHAGYTHLAQLTMVTTRELLALHGVGPKAIRLLRDVLAERGESFADERPA